MRFGVLGAAALAACVSHSASAAVLVHTWEQDGDVLLQYDGALDVSGLTSFEGLGPIQRIIPNVSAFANVGPTFTFPLYQSGSVFSSVVGTAGPGTSVDPTSTSGDSFGAGSFGDLALPFGYVSGDQISGGMVFAGQTLDSLGLVIGSVVYTLRSSDTITWSIGSAPAPVPLPAGLPLLLGGIAGFAVLRRRTRPAQGSAQ